MTSLHFGAMYAITHFSTSKEDDKSLERATSLKPLLETRGKEQACDVVVRLRDGWGPAEFGKRHPALLVHTGRDARKARQYEKQNVFIKEVDAFVEELEAKNAGLSIYRDKTPFPDMDTKRPPNELVRDEVLLQQINATRDRDWPKMYLLKPEFKAQLEAFFKEKGMGYEEYNDGGIGFMVEESILVGKGHVGDFRFAKDVEENLGNGTLNIYTGFAFTNAERLYAFTERLVKKLLKR